MGSSVDVHRAAHDSFNARDWERLRSQVSETVAYSDRPRALDAGSFDEFVDYLKEWTTGMSDAKVDQPDYIEAGEFSVCRFTGSGIQRLRHAAAARPRPRLPWGGIAPCLCRRG